MGRAKSSVWTTLAADAIDGDNKYRCALCSLKNSLSRSSSLNIVAHYRNQHKRIAAEVLSAESPTAKKDAMERALERARRNQPTLPELFGVQNRELGRSTYPSRDVFRRVAGVLLAASRQLPLDLLGAAEFEAFVDCCGGIVDKSKTKVREVAPGSLFDCCALLGCRNWSRQSLLFYVRRVECKVRRRHVGHDIQFCGHELESTHIPLCFFDTEEIGKSAEEH